MRGRLDPETHLPPYGPPSLASLPPSGRHLCSYPYLSPSFPPSLPPFLAPFLDPFLAHLLAHLLSHLLAHLPVHLLVHLTVLPCPSPYPLSLFSSLFLSLPISLPVSHPTLCHLPAHLPVHLPTHLPARFHVHLPIHFSAQLPATPYPPPCPLSCLSVTSLLIYLPESPYYCPPAQSTSSALHPAFHPVHFSSRLLACLPVPSCISLLYSLPDLHASLSPPPPLPSPESQIFPPTKPCRMDQNPRQ